MSIIQDIFGNKKGKLVFWQRPNLPIIGWAISMVVGHFLPHGNWQTTATYLSFGFLFTWAYLEITQGVNNFRKILGVVVLAWSIYSKLQ
jgi:hypothetical protein